MKISQAGGGFYVFKNVRCEESKKGNTYADIWMLIDKINDKKLVNKLQKHDEKKEMEWELVEKHLNGFGRMIFFTTSDKEFRPENSTITKIVEGQFLTGKMNGYCRVFDTVWRNCELGYFEKGVPMG